MEKTINAPPKVIIAGSPSDKSWETVNSAVIDESIAMAYGIFGIVKNAIRVPKAFKFDLEDILDALDVCIPGWNTSTEISEIKNDENYLKIERHAYDLVGKKPVKGDKDRIFASVGDLLVTYLEKNHGVTLRKGVSRKALAKEKEFEGILGYPTSGQVTYIDRTPSLSAIQKKLDDYSNGSHKTEIIDSIDALIRKGILIPIKPESLPEELPTEADKLAAFQQTMEQALIKAQPEELPAYWAITQEVFAVHSKRINTLSKTRKVVPFRQDSSYKSSTSPELRLPTKDELKFYRMHIGVTDPESGLRLPYPAEVSPETLWPTRDKSLKLNVEQHVRKCWGIFIDAGLFQLDHLRLYDKSGYSAFFTWCSKHGKKASEIIPPKSNRIDKEYLSLKNDKSFINLYKEKIRAARIFERRGNRLAKTP